MSKNSPTVDNLLSRVFAKKIGLRQITANGVSIAIGISFSLPIFAQDLPSNTNRINDGFFGSNSTNASERFFEQGEDLIEQEVIELEQDPTYAEDDEILEVDPEVTDDNQEIQQTESD